MVDVRLAPYVLNLSTYGGEGGLHRALPSTTLSVMLADEAPVDIGWADDPGSWRSLRSVVSGLHTRPAAIRNHGAPRGIWLALTPLGARAVLGLPAAELAGEIADLGTAVPGLADLPEQLSELTGEGCRLEHVEKVLLKALAGHDEPPLRTTLEVVTGATRVQEAADLLGYSRRHVSGVFRSEFGVTPKEYQRIVRFETARRLLDEPPHHLATVAAEAGYADQAHLTREWRSLAGCTPARWLSER